MFVTSNTSLYHDQEDLDSAKVIMFSDFVKSLRTKSNCSLWTWWSMWDKTSVPIPRVIQCWHRFLCDWGNCSLRCLWWFHVALQFATNRGFGWRSLEISCVNLTVTNYWVSLLSAPQLRTRSSHLASSVDWEWSMGLQTREWLRVPQCLVPAAQLFLCPSPWP